MRCIRCQSEKIAPLTSLTSLGYKRYQCRTCRARFNERSGTDFNHLELPTDVVLNALRIYLYRGLSYRGTVRALKSRGFEVSYQTVHDWVQRYSDSAELKNYMDRWSQPSQIAVTETQLTLAREKYVLYRAIDHEGNVLDHLLGRELDKKRISDFFQGALKVEHVFL